MSSRLTPKPRVPLFGSAATLALAAVGASGCVVIVEPPMHVDDDAAVPADAYTPPPMPPPDAGADAPAPPRDAPMVDGLVVPVDAADPPPPMPPPTDAAVDPDTGAIPPMPPPMPPPPVPPPMPAPKG
ncbi:MAG: hypothetical protein K1X94_13205 [Sandaracinaceae bacterium]|nr:hypothetical protein [Sandaracinaceae bacterium]